MKSLHFDTTRTVLGHASQVSAQCAHAISIWDVMLY